MDSFGNTRRAVVAASAALVLAPAAANAARRKVVTLLGDSITAGYGLPAGQALPRQLQAEIDRLGVPATIRGAGVSGDTTAGGLARLDRAVRADTDVCVIALGGNDLMTIQDPARVKANLAEMVRRLKARGVKVVLAGVAAPPELGAYARAFNQAYAAVARQSGVVFYPDILAGVFMRRDLNQADGVHPNAKGVAVIAAKLAPVIGRVVKG